MMEFTMSRVCIMICGIVLLAAVIAPITYLYEDSAENELALITENTAELINRFTRSDADVMTISLRDVIPDPSYTLCLNGRILTLEKNEKIFTAGLTVNVNECTFGYNDIMELKKTEKGLEIKKLE